MDSSTSAAAAGEAAVPPEDDVCSVCHDRFRIPCQANCSHWFCGKSLPLPCLLSLLAPPRLAPLPPTGINLEVARPTLLHPKTVQRTNGPPADPPTRVQGADADDGMLGLFGFVDDLLILLIVFLHLAAVYRSLLLYRHGGQ
ncbi:Mitochondrial transcription termination factor family protein [Zea mays]|uniref:Mitochondrial transcription termination factor family protein n=1 Tax=Zea mays TaxID=4577 RepID=A0A1D6LBB9_MAIZE|nr:Mitochondrial transcription termination factor family protein [Zea mays]ONM11400.1 Mitochondrial transcription termination factor family protein [Zea mays]